MTEFRIRMGSVAVDWEANRKIVASNLAADRRLDHGLMPPRYIPDPQYPSGWLIVRLEPQTREPE